MFFRREVYITRDQNQLDRVSRTLSQHNIDHSVRTNSMRNPGRHHGIPNINTDAAYEYRIFVKWKEYDKAKALLGKS